MNKKRKSRIIVTAGICSLLLLILSLKLVTDNHYRKLIPAAPERSAISDLIGEQISYASGKAKRLPSADRLGFLGMVYHSGTFYEKAAQCYQLAIQKNNSKWIWNYYLGYLDKEMGKTDAAIEDFEEVVRKNPDNNLALYYSGQGYQAKGLNENAEAIFKEIVERPVNNSTPGNSSRKDYFSLSTYAMFQLSRIYLGSGRTDTAEKVLKVIIRNQPTFGPAYRLLGNVYLTKGEQDLSNYYITRANDLKNLTSPVDSLADRLCRVSRSELYLMKQIDEAEKNAYPVWAIELIGNALRYNPDNKYLISKAVKLFLILDMKKQALYYLDKHMKYFGQDVNEIKMIADLLMKKGLYPQAQQYYARAGTLKPDDMDIKLSMILCMGNEGSKQDAIDSLNELYEKARENPKVLSDGAFIMLLLGEKERAHYYLTELRRLNPKDPRGQQLTGILLEQDGNYKEALTMYESSFDGNPDDLNTTRHLCDLLLKMNSWEKAINYYRRSLEYHPNEPYLQESLATILVLCPDLKLRNIKEGREFAERAFINKSSPATTVISSGRCLAEACSMLGDNKNAIAYMNKTIGLARHEKVPAEVIEDLEKRLEQLKQ